MNTTTIPKQKFYDRIAKFQANIKASGLDACLVHASESDMANVRYLSEYWPAFEASAVFVPAEGAAVLLVGPESEIYAAQRSVFTNIEKMIEYRESAEPECSGMAFKSYRDIVAKYTPKGKIKKLGIVGWAITPFNVYTSLKEQFPEVEIVKADTSLLPLRFIKSEYELNRMRKSFAISELAIVIAIFIVVIPALFLSSADCQTVSRNPLTLSSSGWTISANPETEVLSLKHDSLGSLLKEIRLNRKNRTGLVPLKNWTVEIKGENQLSVQTKQPESAWIFELNENNIKISGTTSDLVLTAQAPATADRIVCRLLDPEGVPVTWKGTNEITIAYNGKETFNPSNLSSKNPEVMTFSLGQVSASNLHSLFDRGKDIAIAFSVMTIMQRDNVNSDLLDITIPVPGSTIVKFIPDYYTKILGLPYYSRFDDSVFPSAPIIWGSWTAYYYEAKESDIISNTNWLSSNLKPYGFQYVQIDDGYDRGKKNEHYWIENWDRTLFPHGPEWLTGYIRKKGLKAGLWLVPNSYAGAFQNHPDWYLYDRSGDVIMDYKTPALDQTNPAVMEWLRKLFTNLKEWGFDYFKFDGEFSLPEYAPAVDKSRLYDRSADQIAAYRDRLKLIRSIIGPGTFVEGCPIGTPLNGIGFFNSYFNGADMYNSWKGSYAVFSSIKANVFLNHIVTYVMPGEGIDVSPLMSAEEANLKMVPRAIVVSKQREDPFTGFGTSLAEARTLVSFISLTGVVYPLTSIMPELPGERVRLLKMTMPTMPILPVDLYSRGMDIDWDTFKKTSPDIYIHNYPEMLDLKVNARSGIYDVVGFTNWRNEKNIREISFSDKLGLNNGINYVVFDFWNQKLLGVYTDSIEVAVEPHDTRVLLIHAMQDIPQLIGTSRHITGAYSILDQKWDNLKHTLSGTSEVVKGDTYSLFFYVPDGITVTGARAGKTDNSKIQVNSELNGNSLKLSFKGQSDTINWQVGFSGNWDKKIH
jgi:hypothetical protein